MTPRLLFLPGAGADPAFWQPAGSLLPASWDKVYLGWPGLGDQPPSPDVRSFDDLVARAEAFMDDRPVDLLAQSMGGAMALQVALRHPGRVRRIVLSVTAGGLNVAALGAADWRPGYRAEYPQANLAIIDGRPDLESELHRITQPVLLLWGDNDPISPVAVGERLRDLLPNARLEIIRGGDHGLVHERAVEVAPLIREHLEAV